MPDGISTIVHPVSDLPKATAFYRAYLGADPTSESPYYVGFTIGGQEIGLDPNGHRDGTVSYREVDDVASAVQALLSAGGTVRAEPRDVGGLLVATVADPDGNLVGLRGPAR